MSQKVVQLAENDAAALVEVAKLVLPRAGWSGGILGEFIGAGGKVACVPDGAPPVTKIASHVISYTPAPYNNYADIDQVVANFAKTARGIILKYAGIMRVLGAIIELTRDFAAEHDDFVQNMQIGVLRGLDRHFAADRPKMPRCETWMTRNTGTGQKIIPPFLKCTRADNFHVMYYSVPASIDTTAIKLVTDCYVCEIPFDTVFAPGVALMTVVVIVEVAVDAAVIGARVTILADKSLD